MTSYSYDVRDHLESVVHPGGEIVSYGYNALGLRRTLTDPDGGVTSYAYDAADRPESIVDPRGRRTTLVYDLAGRKIRTEQANGGRTTHRYNCADWLTAIERRRGDDTLEQLTTHAYDRTGRRVGAVELDGAATSWTYDAGCQLTREQRSGPHSFDVTYTYDDAGNRVRQEDSGAVTTYAYDADNRLLTEESAAGPTSYSYDADGNRTRVETPAASTYYEWNEDNRLTGAEPVSGPITFTHDADGRRVEKETPSESKRFLYDEKRLLRETDGAGDVDRQYTSTLEEYGDLVSEYDGADTLYHQYDALGTTEALLDDAGTAAARYRHRAFGAEESREGDASTPFTFVGQKNYYRDEELDLYLAGARHYDPQAGRWLSKDPIGLEGGDANLYRYAGNDPVNRVDPSGMEPPVGNDIRAHMGPDELRRYNNRKLPALEQRARLKQLVRDVLLRGVSKRAEEEFSKGVAEGFLDGLRQWVELAQLAADLSIVSNDRFQRSPFSPFSPAAPLMGKLTGWDEVVERSEKRLEAAAKRLAGLGLSLSQLPAAAARMFAVANEILEALGHSSLFATMSGGALATFQRGGASTAIQDADRVIDHAGPLALDFLETLGEDVAPRQFGYIVGMILYEVAEAVVLAAVTGGAALLAKSALLPKLAAKIRKLSFIKGRNLVDKVDEAAKLKNVDPAQFAEFLDDSNNLPGSGHLPAPGGGPGIGTKAVVPENIGQMRRPVAGKWPAIMKDGKVYVHRFHVEANKMANGGVIGPEDAYGFVELDATGNVIGVSW